MERKRGETKRNSAKTTNLLFTLSQVFFYIFRVLLLSRFQCKRCKIVRKEVDKVADEAVPYVTNVFVVCIFCSAD